MNRTTASIVGLLILAQSAFAQDADALRISREQLDRTGAIETDVALTLARPDLFSTVDGSVLIHSLPVLTLLDGRRFPISNAIGRMGMTAVDLLPVAFLEAAEVRKPGSSPVHGSDATGGVVNFRTTRVSTGGEVGAFYGTSSGKYGREDFGAYITGTVGTDKFQITAGAAYQESSGSFRTGRNRPRR